MTSRRSAHIPRRAVYGRAAAVSAALAALLLQAAPAASASRPPSQAASSDAAPGERPAVRQQAVLRGGDPVYAPGRVCTLGFNATDGTHSYGIASGRCLSGADTWYADAAMTIPAGSTGSTSFPGNDYGLLRYTNPEVAHPGEISTAGGPVDITGSRSPSVGSTACHSGRITGLHCGTVLALNISVSYPDGTVYGLFSASTHAEPGEVGTPAFSGSTALGFVVASTWMTTYYQPVAEVLAEYGLMLL